MILPIFVQLPENIIIVFVKKGLVVKWYMLVCMFDMVIVCFLYVSACLSRDGYEKNVRYNYNKWIIMVFKMRTWVF